MFHGLCVCTGVLGSYQVNQIGDEHSAEDPELLGFAAQHVWLLRCGQWELLRRRPALIWEDERSTWKKVDLARKSYYMFVFLCFFEVLFVIWGCTVLLNY